MSAKTLTGFDLSPQQKRIWNLWRDNPHLVSEAVVSIEGELSAEAIRAALDAIVRRHEILRTQFHLLAGMLLPLQVINETANISWNELDLTGEAALAQDESIRRVAAELRTQPVDLALDPALRATLLTLSPKRKALVLCLPALHADETTLRNLVRELAASCGDGESADAGEPVQYVQFSEWQNELAQGDGPEPRSRFWSEDVRDVAMRLRIPFEQESEKVDVARTSL